MQKQQIIFLINCMQGGGAERVISWLANSFAQDDYEVTIILTAQRLENALGYELDSKVKMLSLIEMPCKQKTNSKKKICDFLSTFVFRLQKKFKMKMRDEVIVQNFWAQKRSEVESLEEYVKQYPDAVVVAFLQHSIQLAVLALENLPNKLVVSERGNPENHERSITAPAFIRKKYSRINKIVFQTTGAKSWYSTEIQKRSVIIPNPISNKLPLPVGGRREKVVVNFCRISKEKNLKLLLNAFILFHQEFKEYKLVIYGDSTTNEGKEIVDELYDIAEKRGVQDSFVIYPFKKNIHSEIINYAMFVSSSVYEGMSNSMLEALAIGLPTICTDCPSGGARAVITHEKNGLLVPVDDVEKLTKAMTKIARDEPFAEYLSFNGMNIRDELSEENIIRKWKNTLFEQE
jgi:glycosyltransferase involved in cell wall biosynthesis